MSKNPSKAPRVSFQKDKTLKASKQNVDAVYLIQNENQILKSKNIQMEEKIASMKSQLINCTSDLSREEKECERIRVEIKKTQLTDDLRLESQKKALQQRIQLMRGNSDIVARKIKQAREAAVFQQNRIPSIIEQKKVLQRTLWECRTQNQGTKIVLKNLQQQLQRYRAQNVQLVSRRKQYGPKETQLSKLIQDKLRQIKFNEKKSHFISKQQSAELIYKLVSKIEVNKKKSIFIILQKIGYLNKILKKRFHLLSLIRKKYLLFVKNKVMQKFRHSFRALNELQKFQRIIRQTRLRRAKNKIFRIWRSQSNKQQYIKIRYFQAQTTIEKFLQSYQKTIIFSAFNDIRYLSRNALHQRGALLIENIVNSGLKRCQSMFFSSLNSLQNHYLKQVQIDESASQHSQLLVLSLYFTNWAKLTKDNKASNLYIKSKYFKELKKLVALRKKRDLSQMLALAGQKINQINTASIAFCNIKKQTILGLLESLGSDKNTTHSKNEQIKNKINNLKQQGKANRNLFSLFKISRLLKRFVQKAFNTWRKQNKKYRKLKMAMNLIHFKLQNDINFGFVKIQKRKFQKLKLSIADKIQSCQFSYNYLVKQNTHIKQVLDNKLLDLQKSKFSKILQRLIRNQKQIKNKYFYKFLKNGYKCWKFKQFVKRIDRLTEEKIKRVFVFLLKQINKEKSHEQKIQNVTKLKDQKRAKSIQSLVFGIFQNILNRNKKMKRILANTFARNLQLSVYNGYNKIKKILTSIRQNQIESVNQKVENKILQANNHTSKTQQTIQTLRERLKKKQTSIKSRILLACRKIYVRNCSNRYLHYFGRWRNKLRYQKNVTKFAEILQRKTRILIKNKLVNSLITKKGDQQVNQLRGRLANFTKQLNEATSSYDKYVEESQNLMKKRLNENQFHENQGKVFQKRTDHMDDIKIASFRIYWGKMICKFTFRQWKIHKEQFVARWTQVFKLLEAHSQKDTFMIISQQMRNQILRNKLKKNLSFIYSKKFRHNAGLAFKIWRIVSLNKKIVQKKQALDLQVGNYKIVSTKLQKLDLDYDTSVNHRIGQRKVRMIFDFLKKYTRLKIDNNKRKMQLQTWLRRGYNIQFYRLLCKKVKQQIRQKKKADNFFDNIPVNRIKKLFNRVSIIVARKKVFNKLFLKKFLHYSLLNLYESFFAKTKNYYRYVEVNKKNQKTFCIQKVIETFDKKRKDILCVNLRRWRKNQYEMDIGKKLFKRITRKAIYNRYEGMFYAWKLQSQAKKVLKYHYQEGEVKKRKVQINRIETFLHQFKKQKGLLLQNQQGNFVMSPRFQKKKEQQQVKEKNLRYKFISRLIMSINGFSTPIKAYNNLQMYMKLRQKYKKTASFVLNHMRRPDLLLVFSTWRKASTKFKQDFQNMERKQLIKILNRQKDKMQMEYSHKLEIDEKIQRQLNRYKIFSHQRDRKQKLCAYIFIRNAKKTKNYAFQIWRRRVRQMKNIENMSLTDKGQTRMQDLQQQIKQLRQVQQQLMESNQKLRSAVKQALQIAQMVKRISEQRDKLSRLILQKNLTCQSLVQQNQVLNSKLHLAQKQAIRLLIISGQKP